MGNVKLNMKGWEEGVKKALEGKYTTQVGVLGNKASEMHNNTDKTNAEIGAIHELGLLAHVPQRSFLKMPLEQKLGDWVNNNRDMYEECLKKGDMKKWFTNIGLAAEKIINDAFASGGFGEWPELSPVTIANKGGRSMILVDSGQLRASITSRVVDKQ